MPLYRYICDSCTTIVEIQCSVDERKDHEVLCKRCHEGTMRRVIGNNGGFRLGDNGSVGWARDGYGATYGDCENAKAGRKVY